MKCHWIPVVRAGRLRRNDLWVRIGDARQFDRASALRVYAARPSDSTHKGSRGNKLPCLSVEDVEESILICLKQDFARPATDGQICLHERLRRVVIETVARCDVKVPNEFARTRFDGYDASRVKAVAFPAERAIPCRSVARSKEK